ncbi:MAG: effector-associated domain EAD1-containing protein [Caldilineaceae bacterium]
MSDITALYTVLAELYPTQEDSRRVVESAGLNPVHITFSNKAINNWYNILVEAKKCDRVAALLQFALREYSTNADLIDAIQMQGAFQPQQSNVGGTQAVTINNINTNGGVYVAGNMSTNGGDFVGRDK